MQHRHKYIIGSVLLLLEEASQGEVATLATLDDALLLFLITLATLSQSLKSICQIHASMCVLVVRAFINCVRFST